MNKEIFVKEIEKLNILVNSDMLNKLDIYLKYLISYNEHTNLTTITNEEDVYLKHFYDSLTIVKGINLNNINNLLDVGSGAGFPGMIIKIFFPHIDVALIDSNNKKTNFLKELSNKLDIKVNIINDRVENYAKNNLNKFDIVTSRAVANLRVLSELCLPLVKKDGVFIALKGNIDELMEDSLETISILNGKIINKIKFNLYKNNGVRNIIVIKKLDITKIESIRTYDKILKKPLKKNIK